MVLSRDYKTLRRHSDSPLRIIIRTKVTDCDGASEPKQL